jgi:hypothetical protein
MAPKDELKARLKAEAEVAAEQMLGNGIWYS